MCSCFSACRNVFKKNKNDTIISDQQVADKIDKITANTTEKCKRVENEAVKLAQNTNNKADNLVGQIKYNTSHLITTARDTAEAKRRFMAEGIKSADDGIDAKFREAKETMARTSQEIRNSIQDAVQETERNLEHTVNKNC